MISGNKRKAIDQIYSDRYYLDYCLKVTKHDTDTANELRQYICEQFIKINDQHFNDICDRGKLKQYFAGVAYKSANSTTSPFYREFVSRITPAQAIEWVSDSTEQYNIEMDYTASKVRSLVDEYKRESEENWFKAELFKLTLEGHTYRKIQELTGIHYVCAQISVTKFKKEIKKRYEYSVSRQ